MATDDSVHETTITDSGMVTLPAAIRRRLDVGPGDELRWEVVDGELRIEVVGERYGAFDDARPVPLGDDSLESYDRECRGAASTGDE